MTDQHTKTLAEIRAQYKTASEKREVSILVAGDSKSGKTNLLRTCPKPILVDMFDPLGDIVLEKKSKLHPDWASIEDGSILVRIFSKERSSAPTEYERWERQWQSDLDSKFFANFGTYCIDSATTWIQALTNRLIKIQQRKNKGLEIQDYPILYNTVRDVVKLSCEQGPLFMMTAHTVTDKDETTGALVKELLIYKTLKAELPMLFSEFYSMEKKQVGADVKHVLLTTDKGLYKAGGRLNFDNTLKQEEEPNIKDILKKTGFTIPDKQF